MTALIALGNTGTRLAQMVIGHSHVGKVDVFVFDSCLSSLKREKRNLAQKNPHRISFVFQNTQYVSLLEIAAVNRGEITASEVLKKTDCNETFGTLCIFPYAFRQTAGRRCCFSIERDAQAVHDLSQFWKEIASRYDSIILTASLGETDSAALIHLAPIFQKYEIPMAVFIAKPLHTASPKRQQAANMLQQQLDKIPNLIIDVLDPEILRKRNTGYIPAVDRVLQIDDELVGRCLLEQVILQQTIFRIQPGERLILGTEDLDFYPDKMICKDNEAFVQLQARGEGGEIFEEKIPSGQICHYAALQIGTIAANGYFCCYDRMLLNAFENCSHALQRLFSKFKRVDIVVGYCLMRDLHIAYSFVMNIKQLCEDMAISVRVLCVEEPAFSQKRIAENFEKFEHGLQQNSTDLFVISPSDYPRNLYDLIGLNEIRCGLIAQKLFEMG